MSLIKGFESIDIEDTDTALYKVHEIVRRPYCVPTYIVTNGRDRIVRSEFWLDGQAIPLHVIQTQLKKGQHTIPLSHARKVSEQLLELRVRTE
ncbi:hypothetical protein [Alicyclobacillus dauci]|uniref:Uncharacterized protein n=1 Tax=Alicyclobacillus dauci TaxID=1475485 RepID=A0ABY6Z8T2_9BACL|nr:hypothetical protein [Alicyclobacillus dauci]WAH38661.1 hypothetical protein NZD86_09345 [Alicyclobacillus dauci]